MRTFRRQLADFWIGVLSFTFGCWLMFLLVWAGVLNPVGSIARTPDDFALAFVFLLIPSLVVGGASFCLSYVMGWLNMAVNCWRKARALGLVSRSARRR